VTFLQNAVPVPIAGHVSCIGEKKPVPIKKYNLGKMSVCDTEARRKHQVNSVAYLRR
jgi:hypothetical protein